MTATRRGSATVLLAAALLVAGTEHTPATAGAARTASPGPVRIAGPVDTPAAGQRRTVTLITGDRVTVFGHGAQVTPAKGREGVTFAVREIAGRLRVVPGDALPLLRQDRLDPRLFDVTTLLESGYDDRRADLPLIMTGAGGAAKLRSQLTAQVARDLPAVDGVAVRENKADGARFWKDLTGGSASRALAAPSAKVWLDGKAELSLDVSVKQIGAPEAWAKGYTGTGVKVAVLDTGVDDTHPDLAGKVAARANFTDAPDARDVVGHGTHVASTIAGSGAASGGRYRGVAPDATLLDGKVCASRSCADSSILAGMQWAAEQGAKVVNLSLGHDDTPGLDPLEEAVQTLTERYGTLFVVAAGNNGQDRTISSPGSADAALTVGAVDKSDALAVFSSRGPRAGDSGLKPDITAPGVDIQAARGKDSEGEGSYTVMSGTSMATPHVSGSAAILAGEHPDWKPGALKSALMASARPNPAIGVFAQGSGRVDVARAITQSVTAEPGGLSFGRQAWPHTDDQPITRKVTYRNAGSAPVTLRLTTRAIDGNGKPLPASLFSVTPDTVTVPAGGEAEASVTADTRGNIPEGFIGGYLEATGDGGASVATPLGVEQEVESYDLTLEHLDRSGKPSPGDLISVLRTDVKWRDAYAVDVESGDSTITLRLPKGKYVIDSRTVDDQGTTMLVHPGLDLNSSQTVVLDTRLGRPVSVGAPDTSALSLFSELTYGGEFLDGLKFFNGFTADSFDRRFIAQLGPARKYDVVTKIGGQWFTPAPDGGQDGSPSAYRLAWFLPGGLPAGFTKNVDRKELATVRRDYAVHQAGALGEVGSFAWPADDWFFGNEYLTDFHPPFTHTEYVNTDGGIRWKSGFFESGPDDMAILESSATRYDAGRTYTEKWNRGVFGPSLVVGLDAPAVTRTGNVITAQPALYGDRAGHTGISTTTKEHVALYRDGKLVTDQPFSFVLTEVPPEDAAYRLVAEAERGAGFPLSTRTSVAWTFRSAAGRDGTRTALPLSVVRFTPDLDRNNTAPAGRTFAVPLTVDVQPGSAAGPVRDLSVEVSYDDGATWQPANLVRAGGKGTLLLRHPSSDGFVSLRARSTDTSGNTVDQTIIRAYRIAR
ncbi:S8 family serine peptidase [Sphaerisporangium fuscum]|uniref:S8 family serine peptidase n=1 Tax=Sphaerisporangium fuscum TaxID=2835868 RepID=UPI001BDD7557|nr:S8 family serine peptidase [Sphaerisporangium fuscum]